MKKIFIIALSCILFSCSSDNSEPDVEGIGIDPELNIYEYTFSNQGDSIAIYSTKGCNGLGVGYSTLYGTCNGRLYYTDTGYNRGVYGDWWYAACPDEKPYGKRVDIVVQPNDTGEERILPIFVDYYDWTGGLGKFVQEK